MNVKQELICVTHSHRQTGHIWHFRSAETMQTGDWMSSSGSRWIGLESN